MEFLVRTELTQPLPADEEQRTELLDSERAEGYRLKRAGAIQGMWRVPGRQANVAIMRADNPTQLHAVLTSLPLWPYTTVTVEALADHPLMSSEEGRR